MHLPGFVDFLYNYPMSPQPWLNHYDPGVPPSLTYPPRRVFDFLDEAARRYPEQTCAVFHDQVITYSQMAALTDRLAAGLHARGLQQGQRVALMLPNSPHFILAYYAVLKAGGVVSALNPNSPAPETLHQLNDAGATWWIGLHSLYPMLQSIRAQSGLQGCFPVSLEDDLPGWLDGALVRRQSLPDGDAWLESLVRTFRADPALSGQISPDDPAIFQYSGGTTGTPKAAIGLHRNLAANTLQFRHWLAGLQDGRETVLLAIPLYHVYGMVVGMSVGIMLGARLVLVDDPRNLPALLDSIQTYQASFYPGVPSMYAAINRHPDVAAGKYELRSIRACISGSAPLLTEVRERFESLTGASLMEGYGLSEAPTATHCNPMLGEKRAGSIGLPLPDVECRIVSLKDGRSELPPGQPGELLIRGPQVMQGYHNQPEETAETLQDGWLHTGDIARMDADGYFYIIDRKKDLIKVSGFSVWPREVEEVLARHPGVLEAAAAGVPHPMRGEAVKAWVVVRPGAQVEAAEIIAWCRAELVYYKVPVEVGFIEKLPRTPVGKLLRRELVRQESVRRS